jgi:hypothetical protein
MFRNIIIYDTYPLEWCDHSERDSTHVLDS